MNGAAWLHWAWVAYFAGMGIWAIVKRERFACVSAFFCRMCLHESAQERLDSAYEERERREALPSARMGLTFGSASLILAAAAVSGTAPLAVLYTAHALTLTAILTFAYRTSRKLQALRYASLQVRRTHAQVPLHVRALVAATTVFPLIWLPAAPVATLLVVAAGLSMQLLSWRVATMPAMLTGQDLLVERFVDARLRAARAAKILGIAVGPSLVFESVSDYFATPARIGAMAVAVLALAVAIAHFASLLRSPSNAEVATWVYAAS